jgi:hypothetical protein
MARFLLPPRKDSTTKELKKALLSLGFYESPEDPRPNKITGFDPKWMPDWVAKVLDQDYPLTYNPRFEKEGDYQSFKYHDDDKALYITVETHEASEYRWDKIEEFYRRQEDKFDGMVDKVSDISEVQNPLHLVISVEKVRENRDWAIGFHVPNYQQGWSAINRRYI